MSKRTLRSIVLCIAVAMIFGITACAARPSVETPAPTAPTTAAPASTTEEPAEGVRFKEAPSLAKLVERGELPPVEERLPLEPLVVNVPEIGKYGGTYAGAGFGPSHGQLDTEALRFVALLQIEPDLQTFTPSILKDWTVNDDFTEYTWYLREGMKWSDGEPFTADDFLFFYEDILLNQELTPSIGAAYKAGGEVMVMEKVDPYTVKVKFAAPYPAFEVIMTRSFWNRLYAPKHYLQKWHVNYNPDAGDIARQEGYESWFQAFNFHLDEGQGQQDTERPNITPWVLSSIDTIGNKYYVRNPYYWKVDQEGNQLPYIDEQQVVLVQDAQMRIMKLINGELHAAGENPLPVRDFTLYKENEEQGQFRVYLFDNTRGSDCAFAFNQTTNNKDLRPFFTDIRFRQAMSLAINRQQINEVLFFGRADVRQAAMPAVTSFYKDWMGEYLASFDLDEANRLLDEVGLQWNSDRTARLLPNGQPIRIVLETTEEFVPMSEMVSEDWTRVGVETILRQQERSFFQERVPANEVEVSAFTYDSVHEFNLRVGATNLTPPFPSITLTTGPLWRDYINTNGEKGEEMPPEVQAIRDNIMQFMTEKPGSPEYMRLGEQIAGDLVEGLYFIGTTVAPRVIIISDKLGNTPAEGTFAGDYGFWYPYKGDTWYFR